MRWSRADMWLFSRNIDLAAFGGSALLALLLVLVGVPLGVTFDGEAPEWAWIAAVLLVDVAHVWAGVLYVYADPQELARRPRLYALVPLLGYALGFALASESEAWFWRALAYLAVLHFVRQQVGWIKLYRARAKEPDGDAGALLDQAAGYAATLGPLAWWHAHLPTSFNWFVGGDFAQGLPEVVGDLALAIECAILLAYAARSARAHLRGRGNPGKDLVVASTALLWWLGIVALSSDYAFTVTNVLIHGIPYFALVVWTSRARAAAGLSVALPLRWGVGLVLLALWACAFIEEGLWDLLVWHERAWLAFGGAFGGVFDRVTLGEGARAFILPLLALPQLTHYVLDGVLWRRRDNRVLADGISRGGGARSAS